MSSDRDEPAFGGGAGGGRQQDIAPPGLCAITYDVALCGRQPGGVPIRRVHTYFRQMSSVAAFLAPLVVLLSLSAAAPAETTSQAPINDSYLSSLNLNRPHSSLNRVDTLTDTRNTNTATIQSDIFSPPQHGGPPEVTGCNGVSEGKTIWYDFYPDATGLVRIRTSAPFGTIMAVMSFDSKTLLPDNADRKCGINQVSQTQELFYEVKAGGSYTIQIGGVSEAGGPVEFLFDYLVKPKLVQAEATLTAQPLGTGVRVVNLSVSAPRKARILVRCSSGCKSEAMFARAVGFPKLKGTVLSNGSVLRILVTAKNEVGAYIEYKIHGGSFTKTQRCLPPGSLKPAACQ